MMDPYGVHSGQYAPMDPYPQVRDQITHTPDLGCPLAMTTS